MKEKKGISLLATLLLMGALPLVSAAIIMIIVAALTIRNEVQEETFEKLQMAAESVSQYFIYDVIANGDVDYEEYADHEFMECMKEEGVDLTLYKGDVSFLSSIKKEGKYDEGIKADAAVYELAKKGEIYHSSDLVIDGVAYYVYYEPVLDDNNKLWGMASAVTPTKDVKDAIQKATIRLIVIASVFVVIFGVIITILAFRIRKSINAIATSIARLSDGEIGDTIQFSDAIVEIKQMIAATNHLQDKMGEIIGGVKDRTNSLLSSISGVNEAAKDSSSGTEQIAEAMEELANATMNLTENVQSVNTDAIDMGEYIQGITENVDALSYASDDIKKETEKAQTLMSEVLGSSEESSNAVADICDSIAQTNESIVKITEAVDLINEIATQTNLLALNASIEAARAGEAGRGFAVVAEEIGKLAAESAKSADTIRGLTDDMNDKAAKTVTMAEKVSQIIKMERYSVTNTQGAFESLGASIEESLAMISEINMKTAELLNLKESIISSISDLSAISEENAASNEEVTASVAHIAQLVLEVANDSDDMKKLSNDLQLAVSYFQ